MTKTRSQSATAMVDTTRTTLSNPRTMPVAAAGSRGTRASPRAQHIGSTDDSGTTGAAAPAAHDGATTNDDDTASHGARAALDSGTTASEGRRTTSSHDGSSTVNDRFVQMIIDGGPGNDGDDSETESSDLDDNDENDDRQRDGGRGTGRRTAPGDGDDDGSDDSDSSSDSDYSPSESSSNEADSAETEPDGELDDDADDHDQQPEWMRMALAEGWLPSGPTTTPATTNSGETTTRKTAATQAMTAAQQRRLLKDMEIPEYHPSPDMPVETWIGAVEGILEELDDMVRDGGPIFRPKQLFNTIGSKVRTPGGVRWFNNLRVSLSTADKTPRELFSRLRERFGRPDSDVRVRIRLGKRKWQPGERYHDYAGQLRRMAEGSGVGDFELLQYFLEGIDLHTSNIVQLRDPTTLADGARLATVHGVEEWNVARGMQLLGREWPMPPHPEPLIAAAASAAVASAAAANGTDIGSATVGTETPQPPYGPGPSDPVLSNPNGVFNYWTGRYERPPDHTYRGGMWISTTTDQHGTGEVQPQPATTVRMGANDRMNVGQRNQADGQVNNRGKRARVLAAPGLGHPEDDGDVQFKRVRTDPDVMGKEMNTRFLDENGRMNCFACGQEGHMARNCPDPAAKARNDEKLHRRFVAGQQAIHDSLRHETTTFQRTPTPPQAHRQQQRPNQGASRPQPPPQGNGGRL